MVSRLLKETGVDAKKLEGKTLEEQYDLLDFLADNQVKPQRVSRNKPNEVAGQPAVVPKSEFGIITETGPKLLKKEFNPLTFLEMIKKR